MQPSIISFFQPLKAAKTKIAKEEIEEPDVSRQPPPRGSPESPPKPKKARVRPKEGVTALRRPSKKARRALDSSDEEEVRENEEMEGEGAEVTEAPRVPEANPPEPGDSPGAVSPETQQTEGSPTMSDSGLENPAGIPRRRTARKQLPKRKLQAMKTGSGDPREDVADHSDESSAKRTRLEGSGRSSGAEVDDSRDEVPVEGGATDRLTSHEEGEEREAGGQVEEVGEAEGARVEMEESGVSPPTGTVAGCEEAPAGKGGESEPESKGPGTGGSRPSRRKQGAACKQAGKSRKSINSFFAPRKCSSVFEEQEDPQSEESSKTSPPEESSKTSPPEVSSKTSPPEESSKTSPPEESSKTSPPEESSKTSPPEVSSKSPNSFFGVSRPGSVTGPGAVYDPSKAGYDPVTDACWSRGQSVPYLAVAITFEKIEEESARLRNIRTLANLFRSVIVLSPGELLPSIYLSLNQLGPAYQGLELGLGDTILIKAVAQATGRQLDQVKAEAQEKGDLGLVAESSRSTQRTMFTPPRLTVTTVFNKLREIARMAGAASMNKKVEVIKGMFVACRQSEARYLIRSLGGKLRIGLAEQSVLASIAQAACLSRPQPELQNGKEMSAESRKSWIEEQTLILKQTYCELPSYDVIVPVLLKTGISSLPEHCRLTPGIPLKPMLAHPTKGIGEVMKRFDEAAFTCEYKYDGERAQIHILETGDIHIYSRNQENNTSKFPDIIGRLPKVTAPHVRSCVIDSEAVAWDQEKRQIQTFQLLSTRKRKDVDAADITVHVCVYAFDLLYLNGESLVKEPLRRRRQLLHESFREVEGEFMFAQSMVSSNTEEIAEFLEQSIKDSCEGLMVKTLEVDATYEIAKRSHNWLKLKKDYLDGVGDTLDLAVIGGYHGKGKRTGVYGGFLLACYEEESEEFQTICKIGTGFKDEDLEQHTKFFKDHIIGKPCPYYRWDNSAEPDHWFDAVQVWEVKCADLSISPVYKAAQGMVDDGKGISLRFPRFLRVRDDKKPEEATSSNQVADLYRKQQQIQNQQSGRPDGDAEDLY